MGVGSPNLSQLFDELNRKFFKGQLPRVRVTLSASIRANGEYWGERRLIRLRRGLDPAALRRALLHEMCHVGTPGDHGTPFLKRLRILARRGEEWAKEEVRLYRQFPLASFPSTEDRYFLRGDLEDRALIDPRPPFDEVVRRLAEHLEISSGDLRIRAPWLKAEWRRARREHDQKKAPNARR